MNRQGLAIAMIAVMLAGCSTFGGTARDDPQPGVADQAGLSAGEIRGILSGKSWRFKGPKRSGTTVYAPDGTSLVDVDGLGTTTGKWQTKDGQLCESFAPAAFIPNGVPMSCYAFSGSGGVYQAGKATFTEAG